MHQKSLTVGCFGSNGLALEPRYFSFARKEPDENLLYGCWAPIQNLDKKSPSLIYCASKPFFFFIFSFFIRMNFLKICWGFFTNSTTYDNVVNRKESWILSHGVELFMNSFLFSLILTWIKEIKRHELFHSSNVQHWLHKWLHRRKSHIIKYSFVILKTRFYRNKSVLVTLYVSHQIWKIPNRI